MGSAISKGDLFDAKLVKELFNAVKGHSTLAKLSAQEPVPFNGTKEFVFSMDKDVDIVAEAGAKSNGGASVTPVTIIPIKIEYGARVSDEFLYASEEEAINMLTAWTDGFAKKAARGLDIMAMHGLNPRTKAASLIIGENSFDTNEDIAVIEYDSTDIEGNMEDAVAALGDDYDVTGWAFAKDFAAELGKLKVSGIPQYPEFRLGGKPDSFNGVAADVNGTVSVVATGETTADKLIVGDFVNAFKWGVAKNIPLEVIEYGNPDNDSVAGDLKGHNQVYLRSEMYIGWAIMDASAFAVVQVGE